MIDTCNECNNNRIIVTEENKRKFIFQNNSNHMVNKVKVDGCYIINGAKCDYLIELISSDIVETVFYIELKGSDINHAIEQIEITLQHCREIHNNANKECYIILSRFPSSGTSSQTLKKKFKKRNNGIQLYIDSKVKQVSR